MLLLEQFFLFLNNRLVRELPPKHPILSKHNDFGKIEIFFAVAQ
jgi:hypothetical protein